MPRLNTNLGIAKWAAKALALVGLVSCLHHYLSSTPSWQDIRAFEYSMLQRALLEDYPSGVDDAKARGFRLPVVVDISTGIPNTPGVAADRAKLDELLTGLMAYHPAAIGIDIDFSPAVREDGLPQMITGEDLRYFGMWKDYQGKDGDKNRGPQIRLGVWRRRYDDESRWLGREVFKGMAAGMAKGIEDIQYIPYYISYRSYTQQTQDGKALPPVERHRGKLYQLAASLYEASGHKTPHSADRESGSSPAPILRDKRMRAVTADADNVIDVEHGTYVIDYSSLRQIRDDYRIEYSSVTDLRPFKDKINRNVVIIGDVASATDTFKVAHLNEPVPGLLVHACSLVTLRAGALYQIPAQRTFWLDLALSLASVVIIVALVILRRHWSWLNWIDPHRLELAVCAILSAGVVILCYSVIRSTRWFWPDFLWIAAALILHPLVSDPLWDFLDSLRKAAMAFALDFLRGTPDHNAN